MIGTPVHGPTPDGQRDAQGREWSDDEVLRLLERIDHQRVLTRHRNRVQARLVYITDDDGPPQFCVEVGHCDGEPEFQGWAADALGAALACAEEAFLEFAVKRGDFDEPSA